MSTNLAQQVFDQVDRDRDFVIDLTRDLVRIPTVNPKFLANPAINREPQERERRQLAENYKSGIRYDGSCPPASTRCLRGQARIA
jgi:acetylornithine deacetylase/succinyl-diaminopimelate desuccinylase-like protein